MCEHIFIMYSDKWLYKNKKGVHLSLFLKMSKVSNFHEIFPWYSLLLSTQTSKLTGGKPLQKRLLDFMVISFDFVNIII